MREKSQMFGRDKMERPRPAELVRLPGKTIFSETNTLKLLFAMRQLSDEALRSVQII